MDGGYHGEGSAIGAKRVLVTGAAGFIGSHLVDTLLDLGCEVVGIDNFDRWYDPDHKRANLQQALSRDRFVLHDNDLAKMDLNTLFSDVDVVFHLAARPGVQDSWGTGFVDGCQLNIALTQRVFERAASSGVGRVVFASSSSVYGDSASRGSRTIDPISPYGVSKAAGEQLASVYERTGLDIVRLRYFTVFGPRQRPDMAIHRLIAATGPAAVPFHRRGTGEQRREFTYVGDVAAATAAVGLTQSPELCGATLDVGGGCRASVNEVVGAIKQIAGEAPVVTHGSDSPGDPLLTVANIDPIEQLVGWRPSTSFARGLQQQWSWQTTRRLARGEVRTGATSAGMPVDQVETAA